MEVKNNNLQLKLENQEEKQKKQNVPSSEEFQKEIDRKINKEKDKKNEQSKEKENFDKNEDKKEQKLDTKDLTTLKLFVLPYINKDILSINLKDSLNIKDNTSNYPLQKENKNFVQEIIQNQQFETIRPEKKKKPDFILEFNPFSTFEKLNNSLKEIVKQEKVKESTIIKEIIEKLEIQKLENRRSIEIKFDKENVGSLKVEIINQDNKISLIFKTSSKTIYDEIKNNKEILRNLMESRNIKTDQIIIDYEEVI